MATPTPEQMADPEFQRRLIEAFRAWQALPEDQALAILRGRTFPFNAPPTAPAPPSRA